MGAKARPSCRYKHGAWWLRLRLRDGTRREIKIPEPKRGAYSQSYAEAFATRAFDAYRSGEWDPAAPAPTKPEHPPLSGDTPLQELVLRWVASQSYETAPKELRDVRRYLPRWPESSAPTRAIEARHGLDFIRWLAGLPSARGGKLSSGVVRNVFSVVSRALRDAAVSGLVPHNAWADLHSYLPRKRDKVPGQRRGWIWTPHELRTLLDSPAISWTHRMRYALGAWTGARFGEVAVLRWSDWERDARPLSRLTISRALKSESKKEGETKTGAVKTVPVHDDLNARLAAWWETGWTETYGRAPAPGDLIVPTSALRPVRPSQGRRDLARDCARVGVPFRRQHGFRHTWVSAALAQGLASDVVRWATHAPPAGAFGGYAQAPWPALCREVARLNLLGDDSGDTERRPVENVLL